MRPLKYAPISCITTEYVGKLQLMKDSYPGMTLYWHFESTDVQVYEEYLIYDVIGMLGSIGGLLGLILGFSFLEFIFYFIDKIYHIIDNFIYKKQGDQNEIYSV